MKRTVGGALNVEMVGVLQKTITKTATTRDIVMNKGTLLRFQSVW